MVTELLLKIAGGTRLTRLPQVLYVANSTTAQAGEVWQNREVKHKQESQLCRDIIN